MSQFQGTAPVWGREGRRWVTESACPAQPPCLAQHPLWPPRLLLEALHSLHSSLTPLGSGLLFALAPPQRLLPALLAPLVQATGVAHVELLFHEAALALPGVAEGERQVADTFVEAAQQLGLSAKV